DLSGGKAKTFHLDRSGAGDEFVFNMGQPRKIRFNGLESLIAEAVFRDFRARSTLESCGRETALPFVDLLDERTKSERACSDWTSSPALEVGEAEPGLKSEQKSFLLALVQDHELGNLSWWQELALAIVPASVLVLLGYLYLAG